MQTLQQHITRGGIKLVSLVQTSPINEMMWSCKFFPHASKTPTLTYHRANSIAIKERYTLEHYNTIFNM